MGKETRLRTDLESPIEVIVEGSQVRYYHRYMLDKHMESDSIFTVGESAIDALDRIFADNEARPGPFSSFNMEYAQSGGFLVLNWYVKTPEGERRRMVREVRV